MGALVIMLSYNPEMFCFTCQSANHCVTLRPQVEGVSEMRLTWCRSEGFVLRLCEFALTLGCHPANYSHGNQEMCQNTSLHCCTLTFNDRGNLVSNVAFQTVTCRENTQRSTIPPQISLRNFVYHFH